VKRGVCIKREEEEEEEEGSRRKETLFETNFYSVI